MATSVKQFKLPNSLGEWEHVSVTWEDIAEYQGSHRSEEFIATIKPTVRRTSGYVLVYSDHYLAIAGTDDRDSYIETDCENVTVIPLGNVRRIMRVNKK